jgi:prepilin-type N-terminal cleavage/methylation domain-containing protein
MAINDRSGFTLVELMVVVVIIGILASLAIPRFNMVSHQAKVKEAELMLKHVYQAQQTWQTTYSVPTASLADLESVGYSPPPHMAFYHLPSPSDGYSLPLCLQSKEPQAWPSRLVDEEGIFSDCTAGSEEGV